MNTLPAELVDLVIYELQDDRYSLRSCSLVCKSWAPRPSAHLFKSLRARFNIGTAGQPDLWKTPFYEFCGLIATSPRVSTHIQNLTMSIRTSSVADVATIALQLPHLRSLSVSSGMTSTSPPTDALPCSGRHIEHLDVGYVRADVVPYFLGLFSSVGTLEVSTCVMNWSMPPARSQRKYLVRNFCASHIPGDTLRYVTALLEPSRLESADVSMSPALRTIEPNDLIGLLLVAGPTTRHLKITLADRLWVPSDALSDSLQAFPRLESFTVRTNYHCIESDWWRGLLAFLPALPQHIRVVRIVICDYWAFALRDALYGLEWSAVGGALEHCTGLECLRVAVECYDPPPISVLEDSELQEVIVAALPSRLRSKIVFEY
ncbi:hypothetical protein PsYK624_115440 [Phanerochaete sordida]|uniref:F-box domain-containing protein n=1 Tax=Phanerochaete sordida TaxID=48140 RepID=A0A9P3GHX3_9APHY|nr:hypothetical protein PsYK624_115440 [Phanerochaete sordida]